MAREMKDSGIEWVGKIPKEWNVIKFKYIFSLIGGNGFPEFLQGNESGEYPFCKVSDINGDSDYVDTAANYVSADIVQSHHFNIIPVNSIIVAKIGAALHKNHRKVNSVPCCIDNNTQALVPIRNDFIRYLLYLTKCIDMAWFDNNSTVPSINNNKLLNFFVPNPNINDQHRIAAFLDRKCAEIDSVIADTQKTIEEYKALKQSIITEAVTKGVRGERKMKDSGVEWIGKIADGFQLTKLKYLCTILDQYRSPIAADQRSQKGEILYDYYGASGVIDKIDGYTIDDHVMLIGEDGANLRMRNLPLMYEVNGKVWINNHAHILKPTEKTDFYFLFFALECIDINVYITGSAQPKLSQDNLKQIWVPTPSYSEQREIAAYIREKCTAIDTLIAAKQQLLTELESYKKSVIYEYVTGKKEVL